MISRYIKLLVLFIVLSSIFAFTVFDYEKYSSSKNSLTNIKTFNFEGYDSSLNSFKTKESHDRDFNYKSLYNQLQFQFKLSPNQSKFNFYNIFQTDKLNTGLRAEMIDGQLAFIINDSNSSDKYRVFQVKEKISAGRWYQMKVEILSGSYLKASINDSEVINFNGSGITANGKSFKIGQGFSEDRIFNGLIRNVELKKADTTLFFSIKSKLNLKTIYQLYLKTAEFSFYLILIIFYFGFVNFKSYIKIFTPSMLTTKWINLFIIVQLILIVLIPLYAQSLLIYLLLFSFGLGLHLIMTPSFLNYRYSYFILAPLYGFATTAILGAYAIAENIIFREIVLIHIFLLLFILILMLVYKKDDLKKIYIDAKNDFPQIIFYLTIVITPVVMILLIPVLIPGYTASPLRIGPDLGSYSKMAQFLLDGGTREIANKRAFEFLGMSPGEITRYADATMTWPFMFFYRWGLSYYQALIAFITSSSHVYQVIFLSMLIPHILLSGLIMLWLKSTEKFNVILIWLGFLALTFNSNLINLWYEGFYGNAFSLVFYTSIIFIFIQLNKISNLGYIDKVKSFSFLTFFFLAILVSYGEGILFIFPPLFLFVILVDYYLNKKIRFAPYAFVFLSALVSFLILLPGNFILDWAMLAFKQLIYEGGNGFAQPHWAMPNEIYGLSNIYAQITPDLAGKIIRRSWVVFIISGFISWIICDGLFNLFKKKGKDAAFYVSALLFFILITLYAVISNPHNNYTYMKTYVFLLPTMFIPFWLSIELIYEKYSRFFIVSKEIFYTFITIAIILNGLTYISSYFIQQTKMKNTKIQLYESSKKLNLNNVIIYPYKIHSPIILFSPLINSPWIRDDFLALNRNKNDNFYYNLYLNYKVALLIEKVNNTNYIFDKKNVLLDTECCLLLDSKHLLVEILGNNNLKINEDLFKNLLEEKKIDPTN